MDAQRIYNYARSRQIEEGALAPRDKFIATQEQIDGYTTEWSTMNTNADAVLPYNHVNGQPPPFKIGGSQINPGLETTAISMTQDMREVANKFSAAMGDGINARAGVIVDELKESSDTGDIDWTEGHEIALCYTFKVWLSGMRKVYDGTRQVRTIKEDGTISMDDINTTRQDRQTGEMVTINDLSVGLYDVVCSAGKSYKSRQGETISGILEIGAVDPNVILEGEDILVAASDGPGMKDIAERIRARKMREGSIPESQWTDDERQQVAQAQAEAAQSQQGPSPEEMIGQAELLTAQTDAQNKQFEQQVKQMELQNEGVKLQQSQQKLDQEGSKIQLSAQSQQIDAMFTAQKQQSDLLTDAVNQMKTITEAFGVQALGGSEPANLIAQQGRIVDEKQDNIN
jgi:hypothetical protein